MNVGYMMQFTPVPASALGLQPNHWGVCRTRESDAVQIYQVDSGTRLGLRGDNLPQP